MTKQFWAFLALGLVLVGAAVYWMLAGTKTNHLELSGSILKVRTGAIEDTASAAVIDFRVRNLSDVPFVIRQATVTLEKTDGSSVEGDLIAKGDLKQLLTYNKFLGVQYNDGLSIRDKIEPHAQIDRMVAVRFETPVAALEHAKAIKLYLQDMDGPSWETEYSLGAGANSAPPR